MNYVVKCRDREARKDLDEQSFTDRLKAVGYYSQLLDKYPDPERFELTIDIEMVDTGPHKKPGGQENDDSPIRGVDTGSVERDQNRRG